MYHHQTKDSRNNYRQRLGRSAAHARHCTLIGIRHVAKKGKMTCRVMVPQDNLRRNPNIFCAHNSFVAEAMIAGSPKVHMRCGMYIRLSKSMRLNILITGANASTFISPFCQLAVSLEISQGCANMHCQILRSAGRRHIHRQRQLHSKVSQLYSKGILVSRVNLQFKHSRHNYYRVIKGYYWLRPPPSWWQAADFGDFQSLQIHSSSVLELPLAWPSHLAPYNRKQAVNVPSYEHQ